MAKEIKVEKPEVEMDFSHPNQPKAEMDIVLAIKHLLAMEDHLHEFMPEDDDEETWRNNTLRSVERLRSDMFDMFEEKDKRFHCMAKHIIGATIAMEEVSKTYCEDMNWPQSGDMLVISDQTEMLLVDVLSKLLGHEIENRKRCK